VEPRTTFELGVYSFGNTPRSADGGPRATAQAIRDALEAVKLADEVGLEFFGFGEHHTRSMPVSSPTALVNGLDAPYQARDDGDGALHRRAYPGLSAARYRGGHRARSH
jgi:hypothetical protein